MCDSSLKRKCSSVITYLIDTDTHTCFSPADQKITAEPGEDVTLTWPAPNKNTIIAVECIPPHLAEDDGIFFKYWKLVSVPESYKNRVDLQYKDGNVSLILKNVMTADGGTFECRVQREDAIWDNNVTFNLEVSPAGECVFVCGSEVKQLPGC